uniref:Mediator of RNA polymerase II transcription subunit 14 n=1 Tax=Panagrolaimus sp. PS1159 TaxID=55785 RepID=A0AC35G013_9BILA
MDSAQNSVQHARSPGSEDSEFAQSLPQVPKEAGPQTISLAVLMDFAIQQTLHELTILSEMLLAEDQPERKKNIVKFAHATRLMFVKLLAVVKWLKQSKKFERLSGICYVLDQQAMCFIETADKLFELSRVELQQARLPLFQVSTAIDVLTTGTYPRLPLIIKDAFVPEEKLTPFETRQTILLLNERLVFYLTKAAPTLPKRVSVFKIHNGTIIMRVTGEFQIRVTILPREKPEFVLLSVAILVKDHEIGGGMDLVHPLQLNTIHEVVQSRIAFSNEPFVEAFTFLHYFSLGLMLDVFECQARKLSAEIASNYVRVESYDPYEGLLVLRYWINDKIEQQQQQQRNQSRIINKLTSNSIIYKMRIYIDRDDPDAGLRIRHSPPSVVKLVDRIEAEREVSINSVISAVIEVRIRERLMLVRQVLLQVPPHSPVYLAGDAAPSIVYELLVHEKESHIDEHLIVCVNAFFGHVVCQVHCLGQNDELRNLERELNGSCVLSEVIKIINRLRILLMISRYRNAAAVSQVKLVTEAQIPALMSLKNLPKDRLIMHFIREPNHFLIVSFQASNTIGVKVDFKMISQAPGNKLISLDIDPISIISETPVPSFYQSVFTGDKDVIRDEGIEYSDGKLRTPVTEVVMEAMQKGDIDIKEPRDRSPWIGSEDQVKAVIAAMEDRLTFLRIAEELDKRGIKYDPVTVNPVVGGPLLRITDMKALGSQDCEDFFENIISASIRVDSRRNVYWPFEYVLKNQPLIPNFYQNRALGKLKIVPTNTLIAKMVSYENRRVAADRSIKCLVQEISTSVKDTISESIASQIIDRVSTYSHLYGPVCRFSRVYHHYEKAIDVLAYTYHKLILAYGPRRSYTVNLSWKPLPANAHFAVNFGQFFYLALEDTDDIDYQKRMNPHHIVQQHLLEKFNKTRDLIDLAEYLIHTSLSIHCLTQLSRHRIKPAKVPAGIEPQPTYPVEYQIYIYAISEYLIRVTIGPVHLEFLLLSRNSVCLRDVTPERPLARGLHSFIESLKDTPFCDEDFNEFKDELEILDENVIPEMKVPENLRPPGSLPPNTSNRAPIDIQNPRSVPESYVTTNRGNDKGKDNEDVEMTTVATAPTSTTPQPSIQESIPSRDVIYLDYRQLMRVCTDLHQTGIPFHNYFTTLLESFEKQSQTST